MKPFILSEDEWRSLEKRLKQDHPPSVFLSREKMRRVLGFTPRTHQDWVPHRTGDICWGECVCNVYLDFFDDRQRTMFLLKYGNGKD
jgi:hypothetical protein